MNLPAFFYASERMYCGNPRRYWSKNLFIPLLKSGQGMPQRLSDLVRIQVQVMCARRYQVALINRGGQDQA